MASPIGAIELTDDEQKISDRLCWTLKEFSGLSPDAQHEMLGALESLAKSLFQRKAFPKIRMDYFVDPNLNPGDYGKSRKEKFERNGTEGEAILRHAHFLPHLRYMIFGPDLPPDTVENFADAIDRLDSTSFAKWIRDEVHAKRLDPTKASDAFFMLGHELGKPILADYARTTARGVRI